MKAIRVWDLPTRLFHWALVVIIAGAFITQYLGGEAMAWHFRFGYAALVLVLFRVLWGLIGPRYARFASFLRSPATIVSYLRGRTGGHGSGHNPLGGLSVLAMLAVILLQAGSGLFSNDDIATEGPLAHVIDKGLSDQLSWLHAQVTGPLIYGLIGLHLLAIAYHRVFKKRDLVTPMITGDQLTESDDLPANDNAPVRTVALLLMGCCAMGVYGVVHW
ncbi:cytochrome b/b6 domain-containing protein [Aquabacterium sp.]|uniref:cytochrome b/b6 domain-containing protein n=1 Tax=Aquabacterium sp. TaxID=1872578 RepID=UPI003D6CA106